MTYEQVKQRIFATATIPNGYFGDTEQVGLALIGSTVVCVADCGYFRSPLPDVASEAEAMWLMQHDPRQRAYFRNVKG